MSGEKYRPKVKGYMFVEILPTRCLQIFGKPALVPKIAARSGELCTVPQQCVLDENYAPDLSY